MSAGKREGFTTGTAASAAAFAAVALLLSGSLPGRADVLLPPFLRRGNGWSCAPERRLLIDVEDGAFLSEGCAWASVIKDGGDDPDATHGARIIVHAAFGPYSLAYDPAAGKHPADEGGALASLLPSHPAQPIPVAGFGNEVFLHNGKGVGLVSLPGLPVPVGEAAINPEPRRQIAAAASAAAALHAYTGPLHLLISVPDGERRAEHTLNSRLGILGGISILGTRGTVRPYSHEAWKCAISQGMSVAKALGMKELLLSTGRRSERLGFALYPSLPPYAGIQVADYAAFSLREARDRGFPRLLWCCFPGKLLKLAQGLEWTHARAGASDIPLLARLCRASGGSEALARQVEVMPTAVGALEILSQEAPALHDRILYRLAAQAFGMMRAWLDAYEKKDGATNAKGPLPPPPDLSLHVFSAQEELLLRMDASSCSFDAAFEENWLFLPLPEA